VAHKHKHSETFIHSVYTTKTINIDDYLILKMILWFDLFITRSSADADKPARRD